MKLLFGILCACWLFFKYFTSLSILPVALVSDGPHSPIEDDFLRRLLETGATECSDDVAHPNQDDIQPGYSTTKCILQNVMSSYNDTWHVNRVFLASALSTLPDDGIDLFHNVDFSWL